MPKLAVLETMYTPGDLTAVAYRDGVETVRTTLRTVSLDALVLTATPDRVALRDDDADLSYIAIELVPDGVVVTGADRPVTVEVTGAGRLAGMCSANPETTERFAAATWRTFDGRVLAVVRPDGVGPITVTCTAEGLAPVVVPAASHGRSPRKVDLVATLAKPLPENFSGSVRMPSWTLSSTHVEACPARRTRLTRLVRR